MKYKAIISDIDGTLAPVALKPYPSDKVKDAIKEATSQGAIFALCTGKPFSLVEYLIDYLELTSPIIVDNGAAIYDSKTKKLIVDYLIEHNEAEEILKVIKSFAKEYRVSNREGNVNNVQNIGIHDHVRKFIALALRPHQADSLITALEGKFHSLHVVKTSSDLGSGYYAVYISSSQATKQHAILTIAQIMGISPNEVIGIGDHYNDLPLLMACGFKVAMGNAVPELKAIADYIAPSVEEDGLAYVLEKYFMLQTQAD